MNQAKLPTARRGLMFVLSSPSGAGKTTLSRRLLESETDVAMSVSVTTRPKRPNEREGTDYYFIDDATFDGMVESGELLEHAVVFDYKYGTPKKQVTHALESGCDVLFDIDWQGTRQLAKSCREDLVSVFILPPSLNELERRLNMRINDESKERHDHIVKKRMAKATEEISHWQEYDYVVVNEDLEDTLNHIRRILHAERFKRIRQIELEGFVRALCG